MTSLLGIEARAAEFKMPVDGRLFFSPAGGTGGGVSTFGLGTSPDDFQPLFEGLPGNPTPSDEIDVGEFQATTVIHLGIETVFGSTYWVFSDDTVSLAARTAFMDLDDSLGLDGSVIQRLGNNHWRLHLDDAAGYLFDDNDNDFLIDVRIAVPEPALALPMVALALFTRIRAGRRLKDD